MSRVLRALRRGPWIALALFLLMVTAVSQVSGPTGAGHDTRHAGNAVDPAVIVSDTYGDRGLWTSMFHDEHPGSGGSGNANTAHGSHTASTLLIEPANNDVLVLMCSYAGEVHSPVTADTVRNVYTGSEIEGRMNALNFWRETTRGTLVLGSVTVHDWVTIGSYTSYITTTMIQPPVTYLDYDAITEDCLAANGLSYPIPERIVHVMLNKLYGQLGLAGSVYYEHDGDLIVHRAYWTEQRPTWEYRQFAARVPWDIWLHEMDHALMLSSHPVTLGGSIYRVQFAPTGDPTQVGLPASELYRNGIITGTNILTLTDEMTGTYGFDLVPLYPYNPDPAVDTIAPLAVRIGLVVSPREDIPNPYEGYTPHEVRIWIEYRDKLAGPVIRNPDRAAEFSGNGISAYYQLVTYDGDRHFGTAIYPQHYRTFAPGEMYEFPGTRITICTGTEGRVVVGIGEQCSPIDTPPRYFMQIMFPLVAR